MPETHTLLIHRYVCPDCGDRARADRSVGCRQCGAEMSHQEPVGEIELEADS